MCLTSEKRFPKRAKEPITVYKVLYSINGTLYPPSYPNYTYKLGLNKPNGKRDVEKYKSPGGEKFYAVNGGYLHAYTYPEAGRFELDCVTNSAMYKMTIPKGAKYYVSENGREICATMLEWTEETPFETGDENGAYVAGLEHNMLLGLKTYLARNY